MKKLTLIFIPFFLMAAGCKKDGTGTPTQNNPPTTTKTNPADTTTTPVTPTQPKPYSLTETFEYGSKTAYAPANVTLSSGVWYFDEALIGKTSADIKNGNASARMNYAACAITMMFDVSGINQISFNYTLHIGSLQLMMSTDGGKTFNQVGNTITSGSKSTFTTASFKITTSSKVRFSIVKSAGGTNNIGGSDSMNIDDITFEGTGDPGFTLTK